MDLRHSVVSMDLLIVLNFYMEITEIAYKPVGGTGRRSAEETRGGRAECVIRQTASRCEGELSARTKAAASVPRCGPVPGPLGGRAGDGPARGQKQLLQTKSPQGSRPVVTPDSPKGRASS